MYDDEFLAKDVVGQSSGAAFSLLGAIATSTRLKNIATALLEYAREISA